MKGKVVLYRSTIFCYPTMYMEVYDAKIYVL